MIIDTVPIITCIVIVLLAVCSTTIANPFFRRVVGGSKGNGTERCGMYPKITVLVLANNNAKALDAHLPTILTQDYDNGYEVIVVGEKGDLPTEAVIDRYKHNKALYATYIPHRSLFMSKEKLAVALGVKAAHNEWIVMVKAECRPQSDRWLRTLAAHMDEESNLVIGYSNYESCTRAYYRFDRLRTDCYLIGRAINGVAYRANGTNVAFRRSEFIANDGFRGNLQLINGEFDFIVNKYARKGGTRIVTSAEASIREAEPTVRSWRNRNVCYAHVRKFLRHSTMPRLLFNIDMVMMHATYCMMIAAGVLSAMSSQWVTLAVSMLSLIATVIARSIIAKRAFVMFGENISAWRTIFYELVIMYHNMSTQIRYSKSDKYDFTTHKI